MHKFWRKRRPRRVALALGSGAARGWAHIGVIEELQAAGLQIGMVAGTSIGALVGAVFAAGRLPELREIARRLDWRQMIYYFLDITFPRSGLIDGRKIEEFVQAHVQFERIENLAAPFQAVATDILTGREHVFASGEVVAAVRASIAIPGMFTPVQIGGKILVDGGLVNPVPVRVARDMGADYVVAVDVNHFRGAPAAEAKLPPPDDPPSAAVLSRETRERAGEILRQARQRLAAADNPLGRTVRRWLKESATPGIFDVLGNSIRIMEAQITESRLAIDPPDLLIRPQLDDVSFMDFHRAEAIMAAGRAAARAALA